MLNIRNKNIKKDAILFKHLKHALLKSWSSVGLSLLIYFNDYVIKRRDGIKGKEKIRV